jgi:hypothetical protein
MRTLVSAEAIEQIARLGEISLPDVNGRPIQLGELWADRTAVLVWLRHYR